ncbi:MAG: helix-turn-helix domain-containing protein [Deltaproteobacteria bacterium]|nr:helix-turn-helix domain-containing protein [Deltaproteobacteria bacterium]NIS76406.1 helix-turn-helix domain-containing protein [Deltaproteobacteria bacterium]
MKRDKSNYIIQSVAHALDVLEEFKGGADELGVTELSKKLKLHKNNVFRILATLESRGYIEQNKATENYRLGIKCLELGQTYIKQMGLLKLAKSVLEELANKCGETTYISILRDNDVVYLDSVETKATVRVVSRVGLHLPVYATAAGKALIMHESEDELKTRLHRELKKLTPNTVDTVDDLLLELRKSTEKGFTTDIEEFEVGVCCVGAPVRDYTGRIVGAISLSGPASRMTREKIEDEIASHVVKKSAELSMRLGFNE